MRVLRLYGMGEWGPAPSGRRSDPLLFCPRALGEEQPSGGAWRGHYIPSQSQIQPKTLTLLPDVESWEKRIARLGWRACVRRGGRFSNGFPFQRADRYMPS